MLVDGHEEPLGADFLCGPRCHQAGMRDRLATIDGFAFLGPGDTVLAVLIRANRVALVYPNGTRRIVLTAADGLSNPTSVAVRGTNIYVPSAAYFTQKDPNLLLAHLTR